MHEHGYQGAVPVVRHDHDLISVGLAAQGQVLDGEQRGLAEVGVPGLVVREVLAPLRAIQFRAGETVDSLQERWVVDEDVVNLLLVGMEKVHGLILAGHGHGAPEAHVPSVFVLIIPRRDDHHAVAEGGEGIGQAVHGLAETSRLRVGCHFAGDEDDLELFRHRRPGLDLAAGLALHRDGIRNAVGSSPADGDRRRAFLRQLHKLARARCVCCGGDRRRRHLRVGLGGPHGRRLQRRRTGARRVVGGLQHGLRRAGDDVQHARRRARVRGGCAGVCAARRGRRRRGGGGLGGGGGRCCCGLGLGFGLGLWLLNRLQRLEILQRGNGERQRAQLLDFLPEGLVLRLHFGDLFHNRGGGIPALALRRCRGRKAELVPQGLMEPAEQDSVLPVVEEVLVLHRGEKGDVVVEKVRIVLLAPSVVVGLHDGLERRESPPCGLPVHDVDFREVEDRLVQLVQVLRGVGAPLPGKVVEDVLQVHCAEVARAPGATAEEALAAGWRRALGMALGHAWS
mmetsp:Transcript_104335/g.300287  ORF Transcript_104335/g.300287 Transcript_104335/m.300287 type:complete len:510 (+) Transcript_104335:1344-2873(+)